MRPMAWPTTKSPSDWTLAVRSSLCGANASLPTVWQAWKSMLVRVAPGLFPPDLVVQIKALACELPAKHGLPLSRWSTADLVRQICQSGLVASISGSTLWRWLHEDAIRPWYHRSWIFPRDPDFAVKAGRVLDLYARQWQGRALKDDEFVISADEKTAFRRAVSVAAKKGTSLAVEKEPPVRLRYGRFEPALSFRYPFVSVSATGRYRCHRPARSTWATPRSGGGDRITGHSQ